MAIKNIRDLAKYLLKTTGYLFSMMFYNDSFQSLKNKGSLHSYGKKINSFFGYYDSSPENSYGDVICNLTYSATNIHPKKINKINVGLFRKNNLDNPEFIFESKAFNWQQGSRLMWLDNTKFIYNDYDYDHGYHSVIRDRDGNLIKTIPFPHSNSKENIIIGLNYGRLKNIDPDYSYDKIPLTNEDDTAIHFLDLNSENSYKKIKFSNIFKQGEDFALNHLVFSPCKKKASVIKRKKNGNSREDKLLNISLLEPNLLEITELTDTCLISHYCWLDKENILLYMKPNKESWAFYQLNTLSKSLKKLDKLSNYRDGHPSYRNGKLIFDTYTSVFGFQKIFKVIDTKPVEIMSLKHSTKFWAESRCDFHPRFSYDTKSIFFDSVRSGERKLYRYKV